MVALITGESMTKDELLDLLYFIGLIVIVNVVAFILAQSQARAHGGRTRCRDGWMSLSTGHGTCSWHGGMA